MSNSRITFEEGQWGLKPDIAALRTGWSPEQIAHEVDAHADRCESRADDLLDEIAKKCRAVLSELGDDYIDRWDALEDELEKADRGPHLVYSREKSF